MNSKTQIEVNTNIFPMLMSYSSVSPDLVPPGPGLSTLKSQFMETEAWHSFIQVSLNW